MVKVSEAWSTGSPRRPYLPPIGEGTKGRGLPPGRFGACGEAVRSLADGFAAPLPPAYRLRGQTGEGRRVLRGPPNSRVRRGYKGCAFRPHRFGFVPSAKLGGRYRLAAE